MLSKLARGDRSMIPDNKDKFIDIPARTIRADNVDEFWKQLDERVGEATHPDNVPAAK